MSSAITRPMARDRSARTGPPRMGYQPGLDGIRAISVVAVLLYHAGFGAFHGGFLGVEVFFVVSGFLITGLLLEERARDGRISLGSFWRRRWRRLLPALVAMIVAVCVWAALWGSEEQQVQLRRDVPWALLYGANWGQILGEVPYFAPSPPLLRHVWSLAVEEQWYVVWPLVVVAVLGAMWRKGWRPERVAAVIGAIAVGVIVLTAVLTGMGEWDAGRQNFVYLSTLTRSSGLLLGAALAFVWRPWRVRHDDVAAAGRVLDGLALGAVALIVLAVWRAQVTDQWTYWAWLPIVSVASAVLVGCVVHPWAAGARAVLGWTPLVEVGKRSYGLYVWSWPISRIVGAYEGSVAKFVTAMAITAVVAEVSYRFLETPIRQGKLGAWLAQLPSAERVRVLSASGVGALVLLGSLGIFYRGQAATYDEAVDAGGEVDFDPAAAGLDNPPGADSVPAAAGTEPAGAEPAPGAPPIAGSGPLRTVIVGDSTAHALWINAPKGLPLKLSSGSVSGCGVLTAGVAVGDTTGRYRTLTKCKGFAAKWAAAAKKASAQVALVQIGAWDTLHVELDGRKVLFGSKEHDEMLRTGLRNGVEALFGAGVKRVAFDEVPCMRPGIGKSGTILIPERGHDDRVAHLNKLMRTLAGEDPRLAFIKGPAQWCTDEKVATSTSYRYDGVHFYKPGAKLQFETITKAILALRSGSRPATLSASTALGSAATSPVPSTTVVAASAPGAMPLAIVGDSTAFRLHGYSPSGLSKFFKVSLGSKIGCGVLDSGVATLNNGKRQRRMSACRGWEQRWLSGLQGGQARVALVSIGTTDLYDLTIDGKSFPFGSKQHDALLLGQLQHAIDTLVGGGVKRVAFAELPCMRPQLGLRELYVAEIGDDRRVAHFNHLLRLIVKKNPKVAAFITGPKQWCTDPAVRDSRDYRFDGIHVTRKGAKLQFEAISRQLLALGKQAK